MSETDWKACFEEAMSRVMPCCETIDQYKARIIALHTHRTEEDLPENGKFWIKAPGGFDWSLAWWKNYRIVGVLDPHPGVSPVWFDVNRLSLEIGSEVVPPGGRNHED